MRRVKWVGHPSPFDDPNIQRLLMAERVPMPMIKEFRRFEHRRIAAVPGKATFSVGPAHGFFQTYHWVPNQVLDMTDDDFQLLIRYPLDRYMFLDVTNAPESMPAPVLRKNQWEELISASQKAPDPTIVNIR